MPAPNARLLHTPRARPLADSPPQAESQIGSLGRWAVAQALTRYRPIYVALLTATYTLLAVVSTTPWRQNIGGDTAAQSDPLTAPLLLTLLLLALVILIERRHLAFYLAVRTWPLALTLAWCLASTGWASFPHLAFKRSAFLVIGYLISLGIATGISSPWQVLRIFLVCMFGVMLVDLISIQVVPHLAITDIGAAGMHGQKNIAGAIALLAVMIAVFSLVGSRTRVQGLFALAALLLSLVFLVLTRSKTSMGLAAVVVVFVMPLAAAVTFGRVLAAILVLAAGLCITGFLFVAGLLGWGTPEILEFLVGDPTFTARTDIWAFIWENIRRHLVLGTGYGSFWDVGADNDPLRQAQSWLSTVTTGTINQAHNGYLDILLQTGLPGLAGLLLVIIRGLSSATGLLAQNKPALSDWAPAAFLFSLLLTLPIYNLMETALLSRVHFANQIFVLMVILVERHRFAVPGQGTPIPSRGHVGPKR